jgi:hypothetical protein
VLSLHPRRRHDLAAVPVAAARHHQAEAGHVARREEQVVGKKARLALEAHHALARELEVLHLQRPGELLVERLEDRLAGQLLEHRAQDVEVPVVVVEERARLLGAAWWRIGIVARAAGA